MNQKSEKLEDRKTRKTLENPITCDMIVYNVNVVYGLLVLYHYRIREKLSIRGLVVQRELFLCLQKLEHWHNLLIYTCSQMRALRCDKRYQIVSFVYFFKEREDYNKIPYNYFKNCYNLNTHIF
ncbi:hypothetical protein K501DRAFT_274220 [Backusella circina FSU 941]|nr:hypothetical protein K501DRAFT_274220 [Backusella circina FSU 941]